MPSNNNNNNNNNSNNLIGALFALAAAGGSVGAALYVHNKSKKLAHLRRYTQYYDVKKMKSLSFFPNHLKDVRKMPTGSINKKDLIPLIKIFQIEEEEFLKLITNSTDFEHTLEQALSKITIIRCLVVQNIALLSEINNFTFESLRNNNPQFSAFSNRKCRTIVWTALSLATLEEGDIRHILTVMLSLKGLYKPSSPSSNQKESISTVFTEFTQNYSKTNKNLTDESIKQILNDIKRTFFASSKEITSIASDPFLTDKRLILGIILTVYCSTEEAYCQGMNNVVGFIIHMFYSSNQSEQENVLLQSFLVFYCLMKGYHFKHIYQQGLIGLHYGQLCIEKVLKEHAPKIYRDMVQEEVIPLSWSVQWFLTLFTYTFQYEDVEKLWDGIFLFGFLYVIKIAGSIVKIVERVDIKDKDELNKVISEFPKNFNLDMNLFLKMVNKFPVSYRDIKKFVDEIPLEDETAIGMALKDLGINK